MRIVRAAPLYGPSMLDFVAISHFCPSPVKNGVCSKRCLEPEIHEPVAKRNSVEPFKAAAYGTEKLEPEVAVPYVP